MAHRVLIAALLIGLGAQAEEDGFGRRGQVVPFGSLSFQHVGGNGADLNGLGLFPGALWFLADNVAVGGTIGYAQSWGNAFPTVHRFDVEPQVGLSIPMGDRAAFFPRVGVDYSHQWQSGAILPGGIVVIGGSSNVMMVHGFAPVLFFPARHFFIGFGPDFRVITAGSGSGSWRFGTTTEIGGYF